MFKYYFSYFKKHASLSVELFRNSRGVFTIYVYNDRWVGGQNSAKIVNVYGKDLENK